MDYIKRSVAEAKRYIRSYPDPEDGTTLHSGHIQIWLRQCPLKNDP
jgi:hypothetical protein